MLIVHIKYCRMSVSIRELYYKGKLMLVHLFCAKMRKGNVECFSCGQMNSNSKVWTALQWPHACLEHKINLISSLEQRVAHSLPSLFRMQVFVTLAISSVSIHIDLLCWGKCGGLKNKTPLLSLGCLSLPAIGTPTWSPGASVKPRVFQAKNAHITGHKFVSCVLSLDMLCVGGAGGTMELIEIFLFGGASLAEYISP